ncbi:hypothetical protein OEZ85_004716 [Tetradesmus obliquus]|uniref:Uncharacterized protein n=1 Tax=Tetradesmus obliquus TaxID=3088 RepID=A0ABY8UQ50_TETOB|nr:hypothetical protein OEZ85_004716 [Tetradesmus obliquus]WIA22411.1 hypothetical protein OEZ85_004716 [Tetradesmus obliquus]
MKVQSASISILVLSVCLAAAGSAVSAACTEPPSPGTVTDATWNCTLPAKQGDSCTGFCLKGDQADPPIAACGADGSWLYRRGACGSGTCKMRYMVLEGEADFVDTVSAYVSTGWLVPIMNTMLGVCGDLCKSRASVGGVLSEDVSSLNFKLVAMSLVESPSSSSRRGLLAKAGLLDRIVVGYQLACGEGYFPKSLEPVLDVALNTATASGYIGGALIRLMQMRQEIPERYDVTKVLFAAADSSGTTTNSPIPAAMCQVLLPAATEASLAGGILSVDSIASNAFDATAVMCGGTDRLLSTVMFKSFGVSGRVDLTAQVPDNDSVQCAVSPATLSGAANGTLLQVACTNKNGVRFNSPRSYGVLVKAEYGCGFTSSNIMATTSRLNVTVSTSPTMSVTPWLNITEGGAPDVVCGGKPATASFRYKVKGLLKGQKFTVTGDAGPNCTVVAKPISVDAGIAIVTCSGAFVPGSSVAISADITLAVESCAVLSAVANASVPVICCSTGVSYAKAVNASSCYQHLKPATQAVQCSKRAAIGSSFGFANRGPNLATLYLVDDDAADCSDKVSVGTAAVSCVNTPGSSGKQLRFRLTVPNTHRAANIRYMLSCSQPATNTECPPTPSWTNVKAPPVPRDMVSVVQGNSTVTRFTLSVQDCKCSEAFWGVYHTATYRYLPLSACGL